MNVIENDFIDSVIKIRIGDTECIDKFTQLADAFEKNNCKQIKMICQRYRQIGILNLQAEEYLEWLEMIKQAQLKLNILSLYSTMIENTFRIIEERHRDA